MKSLIIKDIYNIRHNAKSMAFMILLMAVLLIPQMGVDIFVVVSTTLFSMMSVTTFSFDDACKWNRYAMIMPVSRMEIVRAKFICLMIFCLTGVITGLVVGISGGLILDKVSMDTVLHTMPGMAALSLLVGLIPGSISIMLLFKFGSEQAMILSSLSFIVPVAVFVLVLKWNEKYKVLEGPGVERVLLVLLPLAAILFMYLMYRLSCLIFSRKEINT